MEVIIKTVATGSPTDINNKGQISGSTNSFVSRGYVLANGSYTFIDEPNSIPGNPHAGQDTGTFIQGINDSASFAGSFADPTVHYHAFIFVGGVYTTIDPPGTIKTNGYGLNDFGTVVGRFIDASQINHGFVYQNGAFTIVDAPGASMAQAGAFNGTYLTGINDRGDLTGYFYSGSTATSEHGFEISNGQFTQIDDPLGVKGTQVNGINSQGDLVGSYLDAAGVSHGFVKIGATFATIDDNRVAATGSVYLWGINDADEVVGEVDGPGGHGIDAQLALGATPNVTFSFDFSSASVRLSGQSVTMDGSDGSHVQVTGAQTYTFTDGTIREFSGSPLMDDLYYFAANKDVYRAHVDATTQYDQFGWHEARNPNANFSTNGYLAANPDVVKAGIDPVTQYDQFGWKEGRDPSANFDTALYLQHNPDVAQAQIDPLAQYLHFGAAEGRQIYAAIGPASSFTHGSFDAEYYLLANPDVAKAALSSGASTGAAADDFAYQHYETFGWHEGRDPNAFFDTAFYLNANTDVKLAGIDPLGHYDLYGWHDGRNPSAAFNTNAYLAANQDVAAAHIDPLTQYLQYGALEARHLA
jgi:hypothetical protein